MGFQTASQQTGPAQVYALSTLSAQSGETIEVIGKNLTPGVVVNINGDDIKLQVTSGSLATFVMPSKQSRGNIGALFKDAQGTNIGYWALLAEDSAIKIPVIESDPALICSDTTYQTPQGQLKVGARNCSSGQKECSSDGEINCVARDNYPAVSLDAIRAQRDKLLTTMTVAGITGSVQACTVEGELNCTTSPMFPPIARLDLNAAVIKSGFRILGVTGSYAPPCLSDGELECRTDSAFPALDKSLLSPWDIRAGKSAGGLAGKFRTYRSLANLSIYNRTVGVGASASTTLADAYDTSESTTNSQIPPGFPTTQDNHWTRDPASDTDGDRACNGAEDCVYRDEITQSLWSPRSGTLNFEGAISYCESLTFGTYSDWRVPTVKEVQQAGID
ncbi:MAG: hypothetical protein EOP09_01945, partial [Proteobacteria bacterium]